MVRTSSFNASPVATPVLLFLMSRSPPATPLFPCTTLFRSRPGGGRPHRRRGRRRHRPAPGGGLHAPAAFRDRKSTRLNSSHLGISYVVLCLKRKRGHLDFCPCIERVHDLAGRQVQEAAHAL